MDLKDIGQILVERRGVTVALPGVYFLIKGDEVVYIGSSNNCDVRVQCHRDEGEKDFDCWSFEEQVDYRRRNSRERMYIQRFLPKYNRVIYKAYLEGESWTLEERGVRPRGSSNPHTGVAKLL